MQVWGVGVEWTKPLSPVTDQLVHDVAKVIVERIKAASENLWTGTITDVRLAVGLNDEAEYGTILQAVSEACKRYGIAWEKAGPYGRRYTIKPEDMAKFFAAEATRTGDYKVQIKITVTCPGCNLPTTYNVTLEPARESGISLTA